MIVDDCWGPNLSSIIHDLPNATWRNQPDPRHCWDWVASANASARSHVVEHDNTISGGTTSWYGQCFPCDEVEQLWEDFKNQTWTPLERAVGKKDEVQQAMPSTFGLINLWPPATETSTPLPFVPWSHHNGNQRHPTETYSWPASDSFFAADQPTCQFWNPASPHWCCTALRQMAKNSGYLWYLWERAIS